MKLRVTVLSDNIAGENLCGEWGLSMYLEYGGTGILLDTGASSLFAENAEKLGIDLAAVEFGVLSHAHYDHADGMATFFERNGTAPFWLRKECAEDCLSRSGRKLGMKYIGIRRGTLRAHADRLRFAEGKEPLCPGVWLLPHRAGEGEPLSEVGRHAGMYRRRFLRLPVPDDFSHEQTLVLETERGLAVFSSCSHIGADRILTEVAEAFPGKNIALMAGGFHLFRTQEAEVRAFARRVSETGVEKLLTGHCTGDAAFALLKTELGERIERFRTGFTWEL